MKITYEGKSVTLTGKDAKRVWELASGLDKWNKMIEPFLYLEGERVTVAANKYHPELTGRVTEVTTNGGRVCAIVRISRNKAAIEWNRRRQSNGGYIAYVDPNELTVI